MEFPGPFIQRISSQFTDAAEFLQALHNPPVTSVRHHPVKQRTTELVYAKPVEACEGAFYLQQRPVFTLDPLFHAGAYYVQESSSMVLWTILQRLFDTKDVRLLDLCAAPGGKSTLMASWLNGEGVLVSNEVIRPRSKILSENLTKWGYANTWVTHTDAYVLGGITEFFDAVVIDAPCSGEGLFRKDPSAVEEWSEANCELCASRQRKILAEIVPAVKEGGYIIYSTCTFNPAENDANMQWMADHFPFEICTPEYKIPYGTSTPAGGIAFYPHQTLGEGFYCCILRKTGETAPNDVRKQKQNFTPFRSNQVNFNDYVTQPFYWFQKADEIAGVHPALVEDFNYVSQYTKILSGYLSPGEFKGKSLVPSHHLAMSIYGTGFERVELSKNQSLDYLSKKEFRLDAASTGWLLATYQDLPLGFLKNLGSRFNNYYPMDWRIRMEH